MLARDFDHRQHGEKIQAREGVKLLHHLFVIAELFGIDGEHAAGLADAHKSLAGQDEVDISCQRRDISDILHMLFLVQDRLIEVGDGPSLRNVEVEQFAELLRRLLGDGVPPGAELADLPVLLIKRQVAVHHGGDADGAGGRQHRIILLCHILFEPGKTILQALSHFFEGIGPYAVFEAVLPRMIPLRQHLMMLIDHNGFDSCGTEFDSDRCLFQVHTVPPFVPDTAACAGRISEASRSDR